MAGPEDQVAAGARGHSRLRASHADREQVIGVLKTAFVQGRLDRDEFGLRIGRALASRTCAELAALTADIPAGLTAAQPPRPPARESPDTSPVKAVAGVTAGVMSMFAVVAAAGMRTNPGTGISVNAVVFLVLALALLTVPLAAVLLFQWLDKRAGRQSSRGLPPGAGGEASRRPAPGAPARQRPQVSRGPWYSADAAPSRGSGQPSSGSRVMHPWRPLGCRYAIGCYPGH
jgi:Domain of unknown function (DUF1707)